MKIRELLEKCAFITDIEVSIYKDSCLYDEWHIGPAVGHITPYFNAWDDKDQMHTGESRSSYESKMEIQSKWRKPHYLPDPINSREDKDYWHVILDKVPREVQELEVDSFDVWRTLYTRQCLREHGLLLRVSVRTGEDYRSKPDKTQKAAAEEEYGQLNLEDIL